MKVIILKTNEEAEYPDSYAVRLVEQGVAVPVPAEADAEAETEKKSAGKKK